MRAYHRCERCDHGFHALEPLRNATLQRLSLLRRSRVHYDDVDRPAAGFSSDDSPQHPFLDSLGLGARSRNHADFALTRPDAEDGLDVKQRRCPHRRARNPAAALKPPQRLKDADKVDPLGDTARDSAPPHPASRRRQLGAPRPASPAPRRRQPFALSRTMLRRSGNDANASREAPVAMPCVTLSFEAVVMQSTSLPEAKAR